MQGRNLLSGYEVISLIKDLKGLRRRCDDRGIKKEVKICAVATCSCWSVLSSGEGLMLAKQLSGIIFRASVGGGRSLTEPRMDVPTLAAALLHDVVEDTAVDEDELRTTLGARSPSWGRAEIGPAEFRSQEESRSRTCARCFGHGAYPRDSDRCVTDCITCVR